MKPDSLRFGKWVGTVTAFLAAAAGTVCPVCIPALVAFVSSVGLGFALNAEFVHALVVALLGLSLLSLLWAAKLHGHWWIVVAGALASILVYSGRFLLFAPALIWAGAGALIITSIVNFGLKRACAKCRCSTG